MINKLRILETDQEQPEPSYATKFIVSGIWNIDDGVYDQNAILLDTHPYSDDGEVCEYLSYESFPELFESTNPAYFVLKVEASFSQDYYGEVDVEYDVDILTYINIEEENQNELN